MSTNTKEATSEVIRNVTTNLFDPWLKAVRSWVVESEKLRQSAVEGLGQAIDNGHRLAKESVETAASLGATFQKQVAAQVERTVDLISSHRACETAVCVAGS